MKGNIFLTSIYILVGLISLDVMVIVHELGHYYTARLFHIETECLQIGFGPRIERVDSSSKFHFCIVPFGGACKFDTLSLYSTHPLKRILMYLAGPVANTLFAILCFVLFLVIYGNSITTSLKVAFDQCAYEIKMFHDAIISVLTGRAKLGEIISGAFKASENIGQITVMGFTSGFLTGICSALYLTASVSLSLGVANMLPLPALDGGYILISLVELVTGRTFSERFYLVIQILGLLILLVVIPIARHL